MHVYCLLSERFVWGIVLHMIKVVASTKPTWQNIKATRDKLMNIHLVSIKVFLMNIVNWQISGH